MDLRTWMADEGSWIENEDEEGERALLPIVGYPVLQYIMDVDYVMNSHQHVAYQS